jgi:hypothetical protein
MNFKTNAILVVPALVLGLACTACARKERVEVVENDDVVTTTETVDTTADTSADMTADTYEADTMQEQEIAEVEQTYEPAPETLPQTAGPLPAIALGGLFSLLAGFGLTLRRRIG